MKNIPNILSVIRILLIIPFVVLIFDGYHTIAGIILLVSALTDILDGVLARQFNWVSDFGKILDPAADKMTQVAVCIVLAIMKPQYIVFFAIMLIKELLMVIASGYLLKKGASPAAAKWFGKAATVVFYFTMILMVIFPNIPATVETILLGLTTALVVFAFVKYVIMFVKINNTSKIVGSKTTSLGANKEKV
ncbi:MAG: CDP-alcohol phosphatidyltransferase family protein [Oscillospiraceae bacterium]